MFRYKAMPYQFNKCSVIKHYTNAIKAPIRFKISARQCKIIWCSTGSWYLASQLNYRLQCAKVLSSQKQKSSLAHHCRVWVMDLGTSEYISFRLISMLTRKEHHNGWNLFHKSEPFPNMYPLTSRRPRVVSWCHQLLRSHCYVPLLLRDKHMAAV